MTIGTQLFNARRGKASRSMQRKGKVVLLVVVGITLLICSRQNKSFHINSNCKKTVLKYFL